MKKEEITERIKKVIASTLNIELGKYKDEEDILKNQEVDSLKLVEILINLEKEFEIAMLYDDIENVSSFKDIV